MPVFDAQELFSENQAGIATTAIASTNYLDLQVARKLGPGNQLHVVVKVAEALTSSTATSVSVTLEGDSTSGFGSAATVQTIGSFTVGSAPLGTTISAPLSSSATAYRYLRLKYTCNTSNLETSGKYTAYLVETPQEDTLYSDGITITA